MSTRIILDCDPGHDDAMEDGGLGHDTGPTNSGFSQFCKTQ